MKPPAPTVAAAPFTLTAQEQELYGNSLFVRFLDIPIVHFLRSQHFSSLLAQHRILLRRADTYDDDAEEATYPAANRTESSDVDKQVEAALPIQKDRKSHVESQMIARSLAFVHCWYEGDSLNPTMWSRYGDDGRGVCIHSTTQALQGAVGRPPDHLACELGRCTYWDDSKPLPEMVSCLPAFRKRRQYSEEREIRLLARIKPDHIPTDSEGYIVAPHRFQPLPVNLPLLLGRVTLGAMMSNDEKRRVYDALLTHISAERILGAP